MAGSDTLSDSLPLNVQTSKASTFAFGERQYTLKTRNGTVVGGNSSVPDGDFTRFLGYPAATEGELKGTTPMSGGRVLEVAMQKEFAEINKGVEKNGQGYRYQMIGMSEFERQPGRDADAVADLTFAVETNLGDRTLKTPRPGLVGNASAQAYAQVLNEYHNKSREDNTRYLEMQYKFQYASKSFTTVSNLMKVRHDAIRQTIREAK